MKKSLNAAGVAAVLFTLAAPPGIAECPSIDAPPAPGHSSCPAVDPPAALRGAGIRVFVDRRTGRVRPPTPKEARALIEAEGKGVEYLEPIEVVAHPGGMRSVDLKGAFAHRLTVRRNPDGSTTVACSPGGVSEER
jgi:hypothetical protein